MKKSARQRPGPRGLLLLLACLLLLLAAAAGQQQPGSASSSTSSSSTGSIPLLKAILQQFAGARGQARWRVAVPAAAGQSALTGAARSWVALVA